MLQISRSVERVHYLWIIVLLLLILSFVVLRVPSGNLVRDYISFAASIASLVLAVVAIFYSIISNQTLYQHIGSLQGLAETISGESASLNSNLRAFSDRAETLVSAVSEIPTTVDRLANTMTETLNTIAPTKGAKGSTSAAESFLPRATVGANIAVYLIAQGATAGTQFDVKAIFSNRALAAYVGAATAILGLTEYRGLKIEVKGYKFRVRDAGEMNIPATLAKGRSSSTDLTQKAVQQIDEYFGVTTTDDGDADEES